MQESNSVDGRKRAATIKDIAKLIGVSHSTVSLALNNRPGVADRTRKAVIEAAHMLNYMPNEIGRSLACKQTKLLGCVITSILNSVHASAVRGIQNVCAKHGYSLIICNTDGQLTKEAEYTQILRMKQVEGIIYMSNTGLGMSDHFLELRRDGVPFVVINRDINVPTVKEISLNAYDGMVSIVHHLAQLGHRRLGYVTTERIIGAIKHLRQAFKDTTIKLGIDGPCELEYKDGTLNKELGRNAIEYFLSLPVPPTAVVCVNDRVAAGVIAGAQDRGLKIPDDLSVTGFYDLDAGRYTNPEITTVSQPTYKAGQMAAEILLLGDEDVEYPICLDCTLIVRGSSGPCKM